MSMSRQAGIVLPGYNPLKVANAPTIGTATSASGTSVSVAFTAPSDIGGGAITGYRVVSTPGGLIGTGSSSPVEVSGLTTGTAYTFKAWAINAYGPSPLSAASNSATPVAQGQDAFTSSGSFTWVAPAGVTSISYVAVGSGGGYGFTTTGGYNRYNGGGGGALIYRNNVTVTPGNSYNVVVGASVYACANGQLSKLCIVSCCTNYAGGGLAGSTSSLAGGAGGTTNGSLISGGGTGGAGGAATGSTNGATGGAGGAGGYAGTGGVGATSSGSPTNGSGGGGGGSTGGCSGAGGFAGGGVGILGQGANGTGGSGASGAGGAGSGGCTKLYGGGGAASAFSGRGAVRIIYPGTTRSFPSTNTGDL